MTTRVGKPAHSTSSVAVLAALICAGFAGNFFAPHLFIGFSYLFGSIFVLMTLRLFGTRWGVIAGIVALTAPLFLFGYPFIMPWILAEPLLVGWLLSKGKRRNLILCDALYWPLLGVPLVWIFFRHVMHVAVPVAAAALLLYWITGITNALVASILLTHLPGLEKIGARDLPLPVPIHQLISNVLTAAVLIPAVVFLAFYGKGAERRSLHTVANDLENSARNAVYEVRMRLPKPADATGKVRSPVSGADRDDRGGPWNGIARDELEKILLKARQNEFNQLTLLDGNGRIIAGTDKRRAAMDRYIACSDGIQSRTAVGDVSRCTPRTASSLPLWQQNQRTTYSLAMDVAHGAPWKIVAESSYGPYQLLLIREYGRALPIVLCMSILALAVSLYTSRRLTEPLLLLSQITTDLPDRILEGNNPLLPRSTVCEIDRLSENFRAMATALGTKFQGISLYNETLEARVRERTRELTRVNEEMKRENAERRLTEQQRDQLLDELLNQLRLLQKIIDAIPNPIFYRDINGRLQGCNHAFEQNWGLSREEIVGKTVKDLFPERVSEMFNSFGLNGPGQPEVAVVESQLRYVDGRNHEVIIYKATYDDIKGNIAGVVGNIVDITLRKKAEAERDRLVVELQQKNKELEGIVYVASHDLRSPLVNIQGFSRKLAKSCADIETMTAELVMGEERRQDLVRILAENIPKSLSFITGSVEKMDVILKGLLRLSRLGRVALCFDTLDMRSIMDKIVSSMAYQIDMAGARIEMGQLAPCMADAGQISQVFSNLLDNAIKYRSPDRPLLVRVFSDEFEEGVRYCVEDNGIGIPRDQQETIWEIFQRLNPESAQGEGLGLTLARRIMSRLGGSIWVESEENSGSRFYVVLPKPAAGA